MKRLLVQGVQLPCSQMIMGSDYFKTVNQAHVNSMLDAYADMGGNTIDTAHGYGEGESERAIGAWLRSRNNRERVLILTKGAHHDENGPRVNPQAITSDLTESLERLQTNYVDFYALHRDDPNVPVEPIIDILNEHIAAGKIRAIGGSNWTHQRLQEANEYAARQGLQGFTFSSTNLSLAKPNIPRWPGCVSADEATCAWHQRHEFPLFSWSSLAGGFMTGRYSPDNTDNEEMMRVYYNDRNWKRIEHANQLAAEKGVTLAQISLAYVFNQSFPTCAIVAAHTHAELQANRVAAELTLTEQEVRWLDLSNE
ncbi:aldo/keto reductase [Paenibacillus cremeus]|uniref:Aldo/keto reductase n=1 Tax=Paenibacillus cremeus TaxID=2163881 RepID=A0A559KFN4_9BACL|nr:aldo/keto reductase [Paenibacillus cremeus]TVY10927.1 aldo/keto reductase [Paenibacillus cremeus]